MAKQNNQNQQPNVNLDQVAMDAMKWAEAQERINSGLSSYLDGIKELNSLNKDLKTIRENSEKIDAKILAIGKATTKEEKEQLKILKARKQILDDKVKSITKYRDELKEVVKESKKWSMAIGEAGAALAKGVWNLPKNFMGKMGALGGLFEMDKAIRMASRDMGLLTKGSEAFRKNIKDTSLKTIGFGVGIKELAELQAGYSELVGRNVMMNENALKGVAAMAQATTLGIEGASQMAAEFDSQGMSAEKTASFVEDTLNSSSKMGLNATKVIKNISGNIKMLNRYRFKDGAKGLAEMAKTVTKLGVDMNFAAGMADKLFDLEPAIEMSAQLQVLGGAWSNLADPFKLMYMARNDVKGLTEEIANAAKESMSFAKDGSIETTAMEMHRLRLVAQQTGLEYDDLLEAGKKAFKLGKIKAQVYGVDDETRELIANTAEFANGKATIEIDGKPKLLSMLTSSDKKILADRVKEKKTMEERAKAAQSFDEKITNLINMVKITMMPIVEGLTEALDPLVKKLMEGEFKDDLVKLGKTIGEFVNWAAKGLGKFVETVVDIFGAKGIFIGYLLGSSAKWIANGFLLAQGFNMGTGGFGKGGGFGGKGTGGGKTPAGPLRKSGKPDMRYASNRGVGNVASKAGRFGAAARVGTGLGLGIAGMGLDYGRSKMDNPESTGGKLMGIGSAALQGAGMGMMFGPWGAAIGGLLGAGYGVYDEYFNKPQNDVKFPKLGPTHSKGRAVVQNGKITPIDNKDDLLAMKPGGVVDKNTNQTNANQSQSTKVEFGELNISGSIKVDIPGSSGIAIELAKNPEFKSTIVKLVNSQLEKNLNGGKNRG